jgi:hypothetical protein
MQLFYERIAEYLKISDEHGCWFLEMRHRRCKEPIRRNPFLNGFARFFSSIKLLPLSAVTSARALNKSFVDVGLLSAYKVRLHSYSQKCACSQESKKSHDDG